MPLQTFNPHNWIDPVLRSYSFLDDFHSIPPLSRARSTGTSSIFPLTAERPLHSVHRIGGFFFCFPHWFGFRTTLYLLLPIADYLSKQWLLSLFKGQPKSWSWTRPVTRKASRTKHDTGITTATQTVVHLVLHSHAGKIMLSAKLMDGGRMLSASRDVRSGALLWGIWYYHPVTQRPLRTVSIANASDMSWKLVLSANSAASCTSHFKDFA